MYNLQWKIYPFGKCIIIRKQFRKYSDLVLTVSCTPKLTCMHSCACASNCLYLREQWLHRVTSTVICNLVLYLLYEGLNIPLMVHWWYQWWYSLVPILKNSSWHARFYSLRKSEPIYVLKMNNTYVRVRV